MKFTKTIRRVRGFALVATLSLMVLLTIVAIGLLSLASISLRSSNSSQAGATARSNARLAMMMALGQLQREMGPDGRISAPHEQDAVKANPGGSPRWTASYDAWKRPESGAETPAGRIPTFRTWLVSGVSPASSGTAIPLLGSGTLGTAAPETDFVTVPSVPVTTTASSGNIAWWISDEGTKAKINAGPDETGMGSADPLVQTQSPQNIGHQAVPALVSFEWDNGMRAKTTSSAQVNLAASLASNDPNNGIGSTFHDVTVHSAGILADVRGGGLKRDLSNLLSRPITAVEGKPLYLADGTMNAFTIGADGALSNGTAISSTWNSDYNTAKQWGINMEELHLFYNLPREISWTGGSPCLVTKGSREGVVNDRHFIYRRPVAQAMQAIFSLKADEDTTPGRYRMNLYMSGMIALSNPNDVPLVVSAGMNTPYILDSMPYNLVWKNQNALGAVYPGAPQNGTPVSPAVADNKLFRGFVGGKPQAGFTLQAGEAGVFGKDTSDPTNYERSIVRGFEKNNNVKLNVADWQLNARNLLPSDKIAFTLNRQAAGGNGPRFSTWLGDRIASNPQKGWQMDQWNVTGAMTAGNAFLDSYIPPTIESPGSVLVSDFVSEPRPILIVSFMKNLENSSPATPPDAFASRPFQLTESAFSGHITSVARFESDQHAMQTVFSAKGMNYIWESLAGGPGGVDLYIGGGRNIGSGGSNVMIQRRIPLTAPLSLGAFQNAIAGGFCDHFYENSLRVSIGGTGLTVGADPMPTTSAAAGALTGNVHALPLVSKAIGNSHSLPHLELDEVYRAGSEVSVARIPANGSAMGSGKIATDHSWMVNTALWDSWYISSIADGTHSSAPSSWKSDNRSRREQFEDLANLSGRLRNTRYLFHPHKSPTDAVTDIFDGNSLKDSAITDLSKYLLVDGAFNVNSTSIQAWTAFLSSIRDQSIKTSNGSDPFNHPLGTIGYAANTATSGTTGDWAGMRNLSNAEIEVLAEKIVDEVKGRGPFLSMADFVNRRPNSATKAQQLLGALQSAIDLSGLNDRFNAGSHVSVGNGFAAYPGSIQDEPVPTRAIGAAGYLTQGDLLTAFGSQIAVRSDTFTIRGYGDARDPSGKVLATAWCEAVVQRVPEYVDPINDPEARAEDPTFSPTNEIFGRRFVICSFRWLQKSEI